MRAWLYLRRVPDHEAAWRAQAALPVLPAFEPGPFPICIQTETDLEAARFDLLAWEDPYDAQGPASPFWDVSPMVEAVLEPEAEPLLDLVSAGGGTVEGLRLTGGRLVLRIAGAGVQVQVRLRGSAPFPEGGGIEIRHSFGLRMPQTVRRMLDFWNVAGLPDPRMGRGQRGQQDCEGAGRAAGRQDGPRDRRGHLRGRGGRGRVARRRLGALAGLLSLPGVLRRPVAVGGTQPPYQPVPCRFRHAWVRDNRSVGR